MVYQRYKHNKGPLSKRNLGLDLLIALELCPTTYAHFDNHFWIQFHGLWKVENFQKLVNGWLWMIQPFCKTIYLNGI